LSIAGISQLPFTTDQVSTAITGVIAVIASVYAWWRNNNLTGAAVQGQQLTDALKANIVATDTDATADATTGTAQAAYAVSDSKGADATADVAPIEEVSYGDGE
ncbi:phage holin, partial [Bifidobacterium bifidum]